MQGATPTYVACESNEGFGNIVKPRSCVFVPRGKDPEVGANRLPMRSITWKRWGRTVASGSGTVVGNMGYREKATLRLYGRRSCDGVQFYTRARIVYRDKELQREVKPPPFRLPNCAG